MEGEEGRERGKSWYLLFWKCLRQSRQVTDSGVWIK